MKFGAFPVDEVEGAILAHSLKGTGFAFRKRSGSYEFDLEAQGAVEAAGRSGSFGPLPDGFRDDVLTVIFSFDPQLIR